MDHTKGIVPVQNGGSVCAPVLASASRAATYRDKLAAEGPRGMTNGSTIPMTVHGRAG